MGIIIGLILMAAGLIINDMDKRIKKLEDVCEEFLECDRLLAEQLQLLERRMKGEQ